MRDGYYKEVQEIYRTLKEKMDKEHNAEEEELWRAASRAMEQLKNMCLAEHGSHKDDGSIFHGFCTRCGMLLE